MLASLIETCKLNSINPEAYFTDGLIKLVNNWPNRRLAELLPWAGTADIR
jgi:transposase